MRGVGPRAIKGSDQREERIGEEGPFAFHHRNVGARTVIAHVLDQVGVLRGTGVGERGARPLRNHVDGVDFGPTGQHLGLRARHTGEIDQRRIKGENRVRQAQLRNAPTHALHHGRQLCLEMRAALSLVDLVFRFRDSLDGRNRCRIAPASFGLRFALARERGGYLQSFIPKLRQQSLRNILWREGDRRWLVIDSGHRSGPERSKGAALEGLPRFPPGRNLRAWEFGEVHGEPERQIDLPLRRQPRKVGRGLRRQGSMFGAPLDTRNSPQRSLINQPIPFEDPAQDLSGLTIHRFDPHERPTIQQREGSNLDIPQSQLTAPRMRRQTPSPQILFSIQLSRRAFCRDGRDEAESQDK